MPSLLRVKLILLAFCVFAVGASQLYMKGVGDGIASVDAEAFDSYAHFAKQMQQAKHAKAAPHKQASDPFTALAQLQGGK